MSEVKRQSHERKRNEKIKNEKRTKEQCGRGEAAQTMYTHVSKCKNDKRRKKKTKN
jgi:hypothetical protein